MTPERDHNEYIIPNQRTEKNPTQDAHSELAALSTTFNHRPCEAPTASTTVRVSPHAVRDLAYVYNMSLKGPF